MKEVKYEKKKIVLIIVTIVIVVFIKAVITMNQNNIKNNNINLVIEKALSKDYKSKYKVVTIDTYSYYKDKIVYFTYGEGQNNDGIAHLTKTKDNKYKLIEIKKQNSFIERGPGIYICYLDPIVRENGDFLMPFAIISNNDELAKISVIENNETTYKDIKSNPAFVLFFHTANNMQMSYSFYDKNGEVIE